MFSQLVGLRKSFVGPQESVERGEGALDVVPLDNFAIPGKKGENANGTVIILSGFHFHGDQ
jgi:hypothetical protein